MATWAVNERKKCWDEVKKIWADCKPPILAKKDSSSGGTPPVRKCCIPDLCCLNCVIFEGILRCFTSLSNLPDFQNQPDAIIQTLPFITLQTYFHSIVGLAPCRYGFYRNPALEYEIVDKVTNVTYRCYPNVQMTNGGNPILPGVIFTQCLIFTSIDANCPPIGLCWNAIWQSNGVDSNSLIFLNSAICTAPFGVVDAATMEFCLQCKLSPTPPVPCPPPVWILKKLTDLITSVDIVADILGTYNIIRGRDFQFDFLNIGLNSCCGLPGEFTITATGDINIFNPNTLPIIGPATSFVGHLEITTPPGIYSLFFKFTHPGCEFTLKVILNVS